MGYIILAAILILCLVAPVRSDMQLGLALFFPEPSDELHIVVEQERAVGQYGLGVKYATGDGVPQDYARAVEWFREAAAAGDVGGQYNLGGLYANGKGVPQDYAKAAQWYHKASEQGDGGAQYRLGVLYTEGRGVPQDYAKAIKWLRLAIPRRFGIVSTGKVLDVPALVAWTAPIKLDAETVRFLQQRLVSVGCDPGPADGILGTRTRAAIECFQKQAGLPVAGEVTKELLERLAAAPVSGQHVTTTGKPERADCQGSVGPPVANGAVLLRKGAGSHTISVSNGTQWDALVKVKKLSGQAVLAFFVAASADATVTEVPEGIYRIMFATGRRFSRSCGRFLEDMQVSAFEKLQHLRTTSGGIFQYTTHLHFTLHPVVGGNAPTRRIASDEFLRD